MDIDEWDYISFGEREPLQSFHGIVTQKDYISKNITKRYQYYITSSDHSSNYMTKNSYIFAIKPCIGNTCGKQPVLMEFILCGTKHSHTWNKNNNEYFIIHLPKQLITDVQIVKYEYCKVMYNIFSMDKRILRIYTDDVNEILTSLNTYNKYYHTCFNYNNVEILIEP